MRWNDLPILQMANPMAVASNTLSRPAGRLLRGGLWAAQTALAAVYIPAGVTKLTTPIAELSTVIAWTGDVAPACVRAIGTLDLAAGLGLLLPALSRIAPRLTVAAAIGASILQVGAMVLHASRGEWAVLPMNATLLALSVFIAWGRTRRAPIQPRGGR